VVRLGRDVLDKEMLDRDGYKAGKVDDLVLELRPGERPLVRAIVTQHGALARLLGRRVERWAAGLRRAVLGFGDEVTPIAIGWEHVTRIDVTVHIDVQRDQVGLLRSERAIWERWICYLPWARR
jgi:sporulation protein YlmC with PRC-barrel domain